MDSYALLVVLLAVLGLGILVCEVFIPSGGILSIMAIICFAGSTFCAWRGWYQTGYVNWWWGYVISMLLLLPSSVVGAVWLLPRTSYGQKILATPPSLEEITPFQDEAARLASLINKHGRTTTMFSPGGMVQIESEKFHAESEGVLIDSGKDVVVVAVKANRLVVRPAQLHTPAETVAESSEAAGNNQVDSTAVDAGEPIDFDFPETV